MTGQFANPCRRMRRTFALFIQHGCSLVLAVLALATATGPARAQEAAQVLIINSYHPGYAWSDGEMRGVLRSLTRDMPNLLPGIEYLDWKRYPTPEQERIFLETLRLKYAGHPLRAIITLDDKAFEFVLNNRSLLGGEEVALIFGGVNYLEPDSLRTAGHRNVTGVVEAKDMGRTLDLIRRLQPEVRELVGFHDDTESSLANRRSLEEALPAHAPELKLRFLENWTSEELFQALEKLGPDTAAISLGSNRARDGELLTDDVHFLQEVARRCAVPIYLISEPIVPLFGEGSWDTAVWSGVGGSLAASDLHGERVGELALRVLRGEPADTIPIETNSTARLAVDWRQMHRFNLPLDALPPDAEIFNQPQSFYLINKSRILLSAVVVVGLVLTIVVLGLNIILRRRAEQQNRRLIAAVEQTSDMIVMLDSTLNLLYTNPAFSRITGLSLAAARARPPEFLDASDQGRGFARLAADLTSNHTAAQEVTYRHEDGRTLQLSLVVSVVRDHTGDLSGYILIARDVTREAKLEEQVRISQKMEAIGLMAGGVAHDFNNLLAIILGYAGLLRTVAPGNENVGEYADTIIQAGHRGADVVRQLMLYANQHEPVLADTDLQTLLANTLIRATEGWPLTIRLECSYETRHPVVSLDSDQVGRAVEHLLRNAREAIKGSGTICLRMAERPAPVHARNQAGWMEIAVIDDGCGMDENTRARMFEPFFSSGKGPEFRGLGLAIVYGIVQAHRGRIEVDSAPGRGTRISILLPAKPGQHTHDTAAGHPKSKDNAAPVATLLLVEDEPDIARLWKDMLTRQGWTVHWAQDGAQALALHAVHGKRIDLVFSDIGLPGDIDGWEVARRLRAERPSLPLVIASGFFKKGAAAQAALEGPVAYIDKPYQIPEVLQRLREFLPRSTPV